MRQEVPGSSAIHSGGSTSIKLLQVIRKKGQNLGGEEKNRTVKIKLGMQTSTGNQ